jgi:glycine betaine/proline transport system substrate-binding protein
MDVFVTDHEANGRTPRMARGTRRLSLACVAAALALGLSACGGGTIQNATAPTGGSGTAAPCGDLRIAVNPWTGYVSNAHVIGYVAKTKLGCNVTYSDLKEEVSWQGMASGTIDTVVENWGHNDRQRRDHRLVCAAVDGGEVPGHP